RENRLEGRTNWKEVPFLDGVRPWGKTFDYEIPVDPLIQPPPPQTVVTVTTPQLNNAEAVNGLDDYQMAVYLTGYYGPPNSPTPRSFETEWQESMDTNVKKTLLLHALGVDPRFA
ncbi:hypothetical protein V5O48_012576, partial [Marasmius crinis-equi]